MTIRGSLRRQVWGLDETVLNEQVCLFTSGNQFLNSTLPYISEIVLVLEIRDLFLFFVLNK